MSDSSALSVPLVRSVPTSSDSDPSSRTTSLALLLGRVAGRRGPSIAVRETAARELEERRNDWGYSKPVVAMDISWNMMFVLVALGWLFSTWEEKPKVPLRVWIGGYAIQCLIHVLLVWMEYRRRRRNGRSRSGRGDLEAGEERRTLDLEEEEGGLFLLGGSSQSR